MNKDIIAGLLFAALGGFFLYYSTKFTIGTVNQMGPGFYPVCVSTLLIVLGIITILKAIKK
jgi:hypothetical protein